MVRWLSPLWLVLIAGLLASTPASADDRDSCYKESGDIYQTFASDLAGLDPKVHNNDDASILKDMYEWLRGVVPATLFNSQPTIDVLDKFALFKSRKDGVKGAGKGGRLSHEETREVMYQVCDEVGWWDWRRHRMGRDEFPSVPLAFFK